MPKWTKIFPSHNRYGKGVCMGASAQWCKEARRGYYHCDPHLPSNIERTKELTTKFVEDSKGSVVDRLKELLKLEGVSGATTINTGNAKSTELISYIKDHAGVYLIIVGTHVMGVSSHKGRYYFYDNENGLYRCHDKEALGAVIKELRGRYGVDEWELAGPDGWRGVKCD